MKQTFIVAEIGINHNGDMSLAKEQIDLAAESGADSVKFQNYLTEDFIPNEDLKFTYLSFNGGSELKEFKESQYEMFKRCELSRDDLFLLKEHCDKRNIDFHSTPTNQAGIQILKELGCRYLKNGSDYLVNLELIKEMGKTGMTTIISTGMASMSDIDDAVNAFYSTGNKNLILLHCTSSYPTPDQDVNLNRIKTLKDAFGCPVGFSDHSEGTTAAILSTTLQSCWIEKHFTSDKKLHGPDHRFSIDPKELKELVVGIRKAEKQMGSGLITPTQSENFGKENFRLSCIANKDLPRNTQIKSHDIAFMRPGTGIAPKMKMAIIGRKTNQDIKKGHIFNIMEDFQL